MAREESLSGWKRDATEALKNLVVWKRACHLLVDSYKVTAHCREQIFKDQGTGAGLSIASDIAEDCEQDSVRARLQYQNVAKGSCGEVWTHLMISRSAGFLEADSGKEVERVTVESSSIVWGLIKHQLNIARIKVKTSSPLVPRTCFNWGIV